MVIRTLGAMLVAALALAPATAIAQQQKDCPQPSASPGARAAAKAAPERIEGQVTSIDRKSNLVTLRLSDGSMQQFTASQETIADLKVGDRIEARKRDC